MGDKDTQTFTPNKDGTISVKDADGNEVRYAKEADLLAIKGSSEAAKEAAGAAAKAATESQAAHKAEIETATTKLETTRQQVLQAEAKVTSLEAKVKENAGSAEELAAAKQALEAAKTSGEGLTNKALEYRRTIIVATYGIPADTVAEKTMEQLDNYEEALKAVIATKGVGNYAIGGSAGGGDLSGKSPMELARIAYSQPKK